VRHVRLHPEADQEATAAAEWYESQQWGLGLAFLEELGRSMTLLSESPEIWAHWPGMKATSGIRRGLLSRFPFGIAYEIRKDEVVVLAVAHLSRRPRYWQSRDRS
jgi:toxin ParE1/3/4